MSRYYKTAGANPIDFAFQLPYQELAQAMDMKSMQQEQQLAQMDRAQALGLQLQFLEKDRAKVNETMKWMNDTADSYSNIDLTDPVNAAKVRDFTREVARTFSPYGQMGQVNQNYMSYHKFADAIDSNKNLNSDQKEAAKQWAYYNYQGVGGADRYGDSYNQFHGYTPADFVNIPEYLRGIIKDMEPTIREKKWTEKVGMYFEDYEEYQKMKPAEAMQRVIEGALNEAPIQQYIRDAVNMGFDPMINKDTMSAPVLYEVERQYQDEEGNMQTRTELDFNPDSYYGQLYRQAMSMAGSEVKDNHHSRVNTWATDWQKRQWAQQDKADDFVDMYSDMIRTAFENGTVELDGTTIKALFADGKVNMGDAIIPGHFAENMSEKDSEEYKQLSNLMEQWVKYNDGEFSWARFWGAVGNAASGNTTSHQGTKSKWNATEAEKTAMDNALQAEADRRGITKQELREHLGSMIRGVGGPEKAEALAMYSLALKNNYVTAITESQQGAAKVIDGDLYFNVVTNPINAKALGLTMKEMEHINKVLGTDDFTPFTFAEDTSGNDVVTVNMSVKHTPNQFAQANFNKQMGGIKHTSLHGQKFDYTMYEYGVKRPAEKAAFQENQDSLQARFESGDSTVETVVINGQTFYVDNNTEEETE